MSRRRLRTPRKWLPFRVRCRPRNLVVSLGCLALLSLLLYMLLPRVVQLYRNAVARRVKAVFPLQPLNASTMNQGSKRHCRFHVCFDINRCVLSLKEDVLGVYVSEPCDFYDPSNSISLSLNVSKEYVELLDTVRNSRYYVSDPKKACVFIPPIDTLAQENLDLKVTSTILNTLAEWNDGHNWLLFSMLPGQPPQFNTTPDFYYGKAMIAGAGFSPASYRSGFDVVIPVFNPLTRSETVFQLAAKSKRPRLLTIITHGSFVDLDQVVGVVRTSKGELEMAISPCPHVSQEQLPRRRCGHKEQETHPFPEMLLESRFCVLTTGSARIALPDFTDLLMAGCIPVVVSDILLPYYGVLDWNSASIKCLGCDLQELVGTLRRVPDEMIRSHRQQVLYLYQRYFSSMATIAMATLDILNERVFPLSGKSSVWWNYGYEDFSVARELGMIQTKKDEGFTAVILTHSRLASLYDVIKSVSKAPSCSKIVVVWNNLQVSPPPAREWPRVRPKIQVVRSKENKLSNRFYPYTNLTTAVLSLDDDINMLTIDELEFGFKAWQEYPNRLVGFPSRVHLKKAGAASSTDDSGWSYESDWLNNVSMVLTGAAFYHKFYHYLYTYVMPAEVRDWVDAHMNCEDVAMNLLVANYTNLPPLKISARKKFVCQGCGADDSLWKDRNHYKERSKCLNLFAKIFGRMPLKSVQFRIDPVLYKAKGVDKESMAYPNMGDL